MAGRQFRDVLAGDRAVKTPVKVFQRFEFGELRRAGAQLDTLLVAEIDLVLEDQMRNSRWLNWFRNGLLCCASSGGGP